MNPTVIRVTESRELLAFIPYRFGFRPTESLVAMSLRAPRNDVGLVARLDLADLARSSSGAPAAAAVARHLEDDGAAQVFLVVYSRAPRADVRAGAGVAGQALARMRSALPDDLLGEAWLIGPAGYSGVDCTDERCCPKMGRSLEDLESTQVGAHMVLEGAVIAGVRKDLEVRRRAPAAARRVAERAAARERVRRDSLAPRAADAPERAEELVSWAAEAVERWRSLRLRAARGEKLPAHELGRLLVSLENVGVRDALILSLVGEGEETTAVSALDEIFLPGGSAPSATVLRAARAVLEEVVAHAAEQHAAPPLTVLGWLAWWAGDGARAAVLVGQALDVDRGYSLAGLLDDALAGGVAPGWARPVTQRTAMDGTAW